MAYTQEQYNKQVELVKQDREYLKALQKELAQVEKELKNTTDPEKIRELNNKIRQLDIEIDDAERTLRESDSVLGMMAQNLENKEDNKDSDNKDSDNKDSDNKDSDNKDSDNKDSDNNEELKTSVQQKDYENSINNSSSPFIKDKRRLNELFGNNNLTGYPNVFTDGSKVDVEIPRGSEDYENDVKDGEKRLSLINKIHVIKLDKTPPEETLIKNSKYIDNYLPKTAVDLCQMAKGMVIYDIEDFLYCKWVGVPINRLITLRRFPAPCIDNIFTMKRMNKATGKKDKTNDVGDIARMVTYMTAETNKLDDILSLSYAMKWKQLTAEFEQMSMFGEQSGVSGYTKKVAAVMDKTTNSNYVSGRSTGGPMASFDPKFDQNRVYGPVDSINETHIRDIGLEFTKEFEITFDYELRSINGRTPEYAMKDILANVLACTFNAGSFWPGARYWVGERPSPWARKLQWMNSGNIDTVMKGMMSTIGSYLKEHFGSKDSALKTLKQLVKGGFALAMGKLLDGLGRPGIPAMNSLLSSAPVGYWHLMVGNPHNPILSIGNLICTGTDIKFPTDSLGYGDFPTKMQVIVKLKPGMPKDKPQIEGIFNHGKNRMYWQPIKQNIIKSNTNLLPLVRIGKAINSGQDTLDISRQLQNAYDFIPYADASGNSLKSPSFTINNDNKIIQEKELYDVYVARDENGNEVKDEITDNADNVKKDDKKTSDDKNTTQNTTQNTTVIPPSDSWMKNNPYWNQTTKK